MSNKIGWILLFLLLFIHCVGDERILVRFTKTIIQSGNILCSLIFLVLDMMDLFGQERMNLGFLFSYGFVCLRTRIEFGADLVKNMWILKLILNLVLKMDLNFAKTKVLFSKWFWTSLKLNLVLKMVLNLANTKFGSRNGSELC